MDIYALSHVALPLPPEDPLYGGDSSVETPGIRLGAVALFGERGVPRIDPGSLLRQHWNPFYDHMAHRIHRFMGLSGVTYAAFICKENILLTLRSRSVANLENNEILQESASWLPDRSIAGLVSAIFMPITLPAGIWGMNFEIMPMSIGEHRTGSLRSLWAT